jgi:SAM-dependent methyltransferase
MRDSRVAIDVALPWTLPIITILALTAPLIFTSRAFESDWTIHLFYLWKQSLAISGGHLPALFVNTDLEGVFFPHFVFYGGTMYAIGGALAAAIGSPVTAYVLMWVASFATGYLGATWLSYQAGLRGWRAQLPGFVLVTSAYYLTNAYGRGAWGEFTATSAIPLFVAATLHLLTVPRWRLSPVVAFVLATVLFSGSHNITLLWGSIFLAGLVLAGGLALPRHGRELPIRRVMALLGLAALGVGANLWFLLPDVAFSSRTLIQGFADPAHANPWFGAAGNLFNLFRGLPGGKIPSTPSIYAQLPDLIIIWAGATLALTWTRVAETWKRLTIGVAALFAILVVLIMFRWPWVSMPGLLRQIQFPLRLISYATFCVVGLTILSLRGLDGVPRFVQRRALTALVGSLAFGAVLAVWQVWNTPSALANRGEVFRSPNQVPPSVYDTTLFRDGSASVIPTLPGRAVNFDPSSVQGGKLDVKVNLPAGTQPIATNIAAGSYLLDVSGVRPLGRTVGGQLVVAREPGHRKGPVRVRIGAASDGPVRLGLYGSVLSVLALLAVLVAVATRSRRRSRRSRRSAGVEPTVGPPGPLGSTVFEDEASATRGTQDERSLVANRAFFHTEHDRYAHRVASLRTYQHVRAAVDAELAGVNLLLDIGNGGTFDYDTTLVDQIVAVDLFAGDLDPSTLPQNVTARNGDALNLTEPAGHYDGALMALLFHHLTGKEPSAVRENAERALDEAYRVLKPGGRLIVVESCVPRWFYAAERPLYPLLRRLADTRLMGHPATLQLPVDMIVGMLERRFRLRRSRRIRHGALILQFGLRWPVALTPARMFLFVAEKPGSTPLSVTRETD